MSCFLLREFHNPKGFFQWFTADQEASQSHWNYARLGHQCYQSKSPAVKNKDYMCPESLWKVFSSSAWIGLLPKSWNSSLLLFCRQFCPTCAVCKKLIVPTKVSNKEIENCFASGLLRFLQFPSILISITFCPYWSLRLFTLHYRTLRRYSEWYQWEKIFILIASDAR